jgi:hypothetical protein
VHFNIFIPESNAPPERLADVGLAGLVEGCFRANVTGPEGKHGTVYSWSPVSGPNRGRHWLGYNADSQTWRPAAASGELVAGRYWGGTVTASQPIPDDLQRAYPYRCVAVELGDHRKWWFPAERDLPTQAKLMDDGSWRFLPQRQFDSFSQIANDWREIVKTCNVGVILEEALDFVRLALGINYRLTPEIESDLGLWTGSNSGTICEAFFGIIANEGVLK